MASLFRDRKKLVHVSGLTLLLTTLLFGIALAEAAKTELSVQKPLVQEIGGIRVGSTHDYDVYDRFGQGFFVANEGHGGGLYYTDASHSYTVHVEIGVDHLIEDVEISVGIRIPESRSIKTATSQKLKEPLSIEHGIKLGMKKTEVIKILGEPKAQKVKGSTFIIEYHTDGEEDKRVLANYDGYYEFQDDRLIRIKIHDGC